MHVTTLYTSTKYTEVLKGACLDKVVSNCVFHNETTPVSILDYQHNDTMHITKTSGKRTFYINVFPSFSQLADYVCFTSSEKLLGCANKDYTLNIRRILLLTRTRAKRFMLAQPLWNDSDFKCFTYILS